jgi:hypothetical protein
VAVTQIDAKSAQEALRRALQSTHAGDAPAAIDHLKIAVAGPLSRDDRVTSLWMLGMSLIESCSWDVDLVTKSGLEPSLSEAVAALEEALRLDASDRPHRFADRVIRHAVFPSLERMWAMQARHVAETESADASIAYLQERLQLLGYLNVPVMRFLHWDLGTRLASAGRSEDATAALHQAMRVSSDEVPAHELETDRETLRRARLSLDDLQEPQSVTARRRFRGSKAFAITLVIVGLLVADPFPWLTVILWIAAALYWWRKRA